MITARNRTRARGADFIMHCKSIPGFAPSVVQLCLINVCIRSHTGISILRQLHQQSGPSTTAFVLLSSTLSKHSKSKVIKSRKG